MHYTKKEEAFLMSLKELPEKELASFLELFAKDSKRTFVAVQRKFKRIAGIHITDPAIRRRKDRIIKESPKEFPATVITNKNISLLEIIEQWNLSYNLGKILENLLEKKDYKTTMFFLEREIRHHENNL